MKSDNISNNATVPRYTVILLLLLLCVLFFSLLNGRPLNNPDEGRYADVAVEMVMHHQYVTPHVNGIRFLDKPPFFYWVEAFFITLFGVKVWALRLAPAFFAWLGCLMTWFCGSLIFDKRTAVIATTILATSPLYLLPAYYINMDLAVATLIASSLLSFLAAFSVSRARSRKYLLWTAYVFAALATLTKGLIGIVFPMMIIGLWILLTRQWFIIKKMRLLSGLLIYAVIVLPWFILVSQQNPDFLHYFFIYEQFDRYTGSGFNNQMPFFFYIPVLLGGFFPWSCLLLPVARYHHQQNKKLVQAKQRSLFFIIWFVSVLLFFSIPSSKIVSYILPALLALPLPFAAYFSHLWQQRDKLHWGFYIVPFIYGLAFITILAATLIQFNQIKHNVNLLLLILFILGSGCIYLLWSLKQQRIKSVFLGLALSIALLSLSILALVPAFVHDSNQNLAMTLQQLRKPGDIIAIYHDYRFDLPVYLQSPIKIVNNWQAVSAKQDDWAGHFKFAAQGQKTSHLMISEAEFWQYWHSSHHVYLFIQPLGVKHIGARLRPFTIVGHNAHLLLIENQG